MVASNNAIYNTVGASISGVTNTFTVTNPSNTASSAARETILVGGATASDPTINWNVSGVTNWEMGIDNSVSDQLTISQGTSLGTNDVWRMTTAGERTMPLQPAFLAFLPLNDNNVTGAGAFYLIGTNMALTEIFDQNADFFPGSGAGANAVFTAPITGRYYISQQIAITAPDPAITGSQTVIITSNRSYRSNQSTTGTIIFFNHTMVDMDAADTATFQIFIVGLGGNTVDLAGDPNTYISGWLVC